MRHITPQRCAQFSCIFLFLIFAATSRAQVPIPSSAERVEQNIQNRESALSNLRAESIRSKKDLEREKKIFYVTLRQDFRQLQILNNEVMRHAFRRSSNTSEEIRRKEIRSNLGEMQNVARRLKTNLKLPELKPQKNEARKAVSPDGTLNEGLLNLDEMVVKFVENPLFEKPGVLDAELSFRAAEDLNEILRLTESLRKLAKQNPKQ